MVQADQALSDDAALYLLDCNSHIIVRIMDLREKASNAALAEPQRKALELQADELQERLAENLLILSRNETLLADDHQ